MAIKAATLEIEIGAKIDKFERSLGKVRKDLKGMETRLGGVSRGASKATSAFSGMAKKLLAVGIAYFGARGIFRMAKSFLEVSTSIETYKLRLEAMLGSQQAATEAMAFFQEVAAKVPFTLEAVIEAGVKVQAFGADLKAWTPIMADLAAYMGVTLPEAAGALGRAFAGGVGAADIFRERGILQVIRDFAKMEKGIDDITKISIPEFRDVMFEAFAGAESKVAGTADKLATTWLGVISMLQDKWFQFRDTVMKTKIFELMKEGLVAFNESMDKFVESGQLEVWAKNMAIGVINAFRVIIEGIGGLMLSFQTLKAAIFGSIRDLTVQMRAYIEKLIIGFGLLAKLGVPVKGVLGDLITEWGNLIEEESRLNETIEETTDKMSNLLTFFDNLKTKLIGVREEIVKTKDSMAGLGKETVKFSVITTDSALPAARNFTDLLKLAKPTLESYKFATEEAGKAQQAFSELAINEFQTMEATIKDFVDVILTVFERWAIGQIIPKIMAALPFPLNLFAVGGAIASIKAIFSGLKSMEQGGFVPTETIAHLHAGERVLSAAEVRRGVGSEGGGIIINVSPVINIAAMDTLGVRDFMRNRGLVEIVEAIKAGVMKPEFREALGVKT